jgi:hypothetical protein
MNGRGASAQGQSPMERYREASEDMALREQASTGMSCPVCGEYALGPPHGWGNPCPVKMKESEAYVAAMDASRMAHIRQGQGMSEMVSSIRHMTGEEEDDE